MIESRAPRGARTAVPVTEPARIQGRLEDAAHVPGGHAAALVEARTEADVAALLRGSHPVLAIGAQSSLTGGATPRGDILLDTTRLDQIDLLAPDRVRAGAGVTLARLDEHLAPRGAFYPPAPTFSGATIGGSIATNAAGAATFKHGSTRRWVESITVVLAGGNVLDITRGDARSKDGAFDLRLGRGRTRVPVPSYAMPKVAKLSAGYFAAPGMDLIDLFIGSEGTLGIVTAATLRIVAERPAQCLVFVTTRDRRAAVALVRTLRAASIATWGAPRSPGIDTSAIEHMDGRSLALLREDGTTDRLAIPLDDRAAVGLLIALDLPVGTTSASVYDDLGSASANSPMSAFSAVLDQHDALSSAILAPPDDAAGAERLRALREAVPAAVNQRVALAQHRVDARIEKTAGDTIVPFERFEEMLEMYAGELARRRLDGAVWGHISDGNVHPNIIPTCFADVESGREAMLAFGRHAIALGGAPLAEHGVGRNPTKQRLLVELYGEQGIEEMRAVKRALDPEGILAPGVLFPR